MATRGSFPGVKGWGMKLTTHLHLVSRSRMCGTIPPLPHVFMAWSLVKHKDNFTYTFTFNYKSVLDKTRNRGALPCHRNILIRSSEKNTPYCSQGNFFMYILHI
jgi:hypothetical protein